MAFLLVSCGILATFIGPAAALLLIPSINPAWPAGGLRFLLPLSESEMWPLQLNGSYVGQNTCIDLPEINVVVPLMENFDCLWHASSALASNILYAPWPPFGNLFVDDLTALRDITWSSYNIEGQPDAEGREIVSSTVWAWSGMSIANIMPISMYADWLWAAGDDDALGLCLLHGKYFLCRTADTHSEIPLAIR